MDFFDKWLSLKGYCLKYVKETVPETELNLHIQMIFWFGEIRPTIPKTLNKNVSCSDLLHPSKHAEVTVDWSHAKEARWKYCRRPPLNGIPGEGEGGGCHAHRLAELQNSGVAWVVALIRTRSRAVGFGLMFREELRRHKNKKCSN